MILSKNDSELFTKLWLPLAGFVNRKKQVVKSLISSDGGRTLNLPALLTVARLLWQEPELIDEFLCVYPELSDEEKKILSSWKRRINGEFILARHDADGSLFISTEDERVFCVKGIRTSWQEFLGDTQLPVLVEATLIPFRNIIITDGLVIPYEMDTDDETLEEISEVIALAEGSGTVYRAI